MTDTATESLTTRPAKFQPVPRGREVYNPMAQYYAKSEADGDAVIGVKTTAGAASGQERLVRKFAMKRQRGVTVQIQLDDSDSPQVCPLAKVPDLPEDQVVWIVLQARDRTERPAKDEDQ